MIWFIGILIGIVVYLGLCAVIVWAFFWRGREDCERDEYEAAKWMK